MGLLNVSIGVGAAVGCIGMAVYSRVPGSLRLLAFYAFASSLADFIGLMTASPTSSNHIYYNAYVLLDFFLMAFALKDPLGPRFKWILLVASSIFLSVYGLDLWSHGPYYLLMIALVTAWALLAILCMIALYRTMLNPAPRTAIGIYLILGLNLLYFCCVIPRVGLHKFLDNVSPSMSRALNSTTVTIDIARFVGIAIGLIYLARQNRDPRPLRPEIASGHAKS